MFWFALLIWTAMSYDLSVETIVVVTLALLVGIAGTLVGFLNQASLNLDTLRTFLDTFQVVGINELDQVVQGGPALSRSDLASAGRKYYAEISPPDLAGLSTFYVGPMTSVVCGASPAKVLTDTQRLLLLHEAGHTTWAGRYAATALARSAQNIPWVVIILLAQAGAFFMLDSGSLREMLLMAFFLLSWTIAHLYSAAGTSHWWRTEAIADSFMLNAVDVRQWSKALGVYERVVLPAQRSTSGHVGNPQMLARRIKSFERVLRNRRAGSHTQVSSLVRPSIFRVLILGSLIILCGRYVSLSPELAMVSVGVCALYFFAQFAWVAFRFRVQLAHLSSQHQWILTS